MLILHVKIWQEFAITGASDCIINIIPCFPDALVSVILDRLNVDQNEAL